VFLTEWNQKVVDAQWEFLEMAKRRGVLTKVPNKARTGLVLN
jgi:hypothetical protein